MRFRLASAYLLVSGVAHASLPSSLPQREAPVFQSGLAYCLDATEVWNDNVDILRNRVINLFTATLGPDTFYSTRAHQAESPDDLPGLLENAKLNDAAEELRHILASMSAELDTICGRN